MKGSVTELEQLITQNLKSISLLKNDVKDLEEKNHDLLKEIPLKIIAIIDTFENREELIKEIGLNEIKEVRQAVGMFKIIHRQLLGLLRDYDITKIEFPDNRLIVGLCDVVDTQADSSKENGEIISIIRNGYIRGEELIRAAEVIEVKNE